MRLVHFLLLSREQNNGFEKLNRFILNDANIKILSCENITKLIARFISDVLRGRSD